MGARKAIVIDNMEAYVSRWLIAEYSEASRVAEERGVNLYVAGLVPGELESILAKRGVRILREAESLCNRPDAVLLDMRAPKTLDPMEAEGASCFIVGGIMGDRPPRGRTILLYHKYPYAARRNLGTLQLSVDGTVKVLTKILSGTPMSEIKVVYPVKLAINSPMGLVEVELPFAYPVERGEPWIPGEVVKLLKSGL
ncbi:MAG: hypothetical protein P3X22_002400 [Thermoprotei archaeon]|nr:hypothetical protein [Thermoprotei archaeon]